MREVGVQIGTPDSIPIRARSATCGSRRDRRAGVSSEAEAQTGNSRCKHRICCNHSPKRSLRLNHRGSLVRWWQRWPLPAWRRPEC